MSFLLFDKPPCVFIRIGKTGSTSVITGLLGGVTSAVLNTLEGDWRQEFEGLFTFAFVRNPFDRLVSCLRMFRHYRTVDGDEERFQRDLSLELLMDLVEDDTIPIDEPSLRCKTRRHALPMTDPGMHLHRSHFIGRFERFATDYQRLAHELGVEIDEIPHQRKTDPIDYRTFYSADQVQRAERIYRHDLREFGYRFDR
jgi:hypothetical protein